jgi:diguanylate cyclase (GGDEF)-like protein
VHVRLRLSSSQPALPLAGILVLAFAATGLRTESTDWPLVGAALTLSVAALGAAALLPWAALPASALLVLPVASDGVIAVLRHSQGGSTSGYAPLAILPVVWVGLLARRGGVAVMTLCTAALFALPIALAGAPMYPTTGWRGVVLWTIVAATVGTASHRVMARQRSQTRAAAAHAEELRRLVATQTAIATSAFDLDATMTTVAEEALGLAGADGAIVELPDGDELVYRAVAGTAAPHLGLRLRQDSSISGEALRSGKLLVCRDSDHDQRVDRAVARRIGARSMVVVPLLHGGRATGVLKVYSAQVDAFGETDVLELLASMIGAALDRADLLGRLSEEAVTDELTGLPNRRAWYQHLDRALARAGRSGQPLSVVALDVDGLKVVNDRDGHAAGDALLRGLADRWTAALRGADVLGRLGGDEFAVVVAGAGETEAREVVARLEEALGDARASAGIATWNGLEDGAALIARADACRYRSKHARAARPAA